MTRPYFSLSVAALGFFPAAGMAQEAEQCWFPNNTGAIEINYEQIGTEACAALCASTEGCTAWTYTPHNFNPTTAPGECLPYADGGAKETHDQSFCGELN